MRFSILLLLASSCAFGQVSYDPKEREIRIDGKPFTTFHYGEDANKPFLAPLRSASGKVVTRLYPMESVEGESRDHLHHRGLWFSYDEVNDVKFWENDPSYKKGRIGKIVVKDSSWKGGKESGTLHANMAWQDPDGKVLLTESRDMIFYPDAKLRTVDFLITLTAVEDVTFGDTKEGAFAIRLAEPFTARKGGTMVNAEGGRGMKNVWGKRSNWVDYAADLGGEKVGVAMFDHPSNPHYPTYWHARDYGLFSLNPFGQKSFDPTAEENITKLPKGQKLTYRWRVVIHPGDATEADVASLYKQFAAKK